jgi:tetratricopeptide (TPR) repeat protein
VTPGDRGGNLPAVARGGGARLLPSEPTTRYRLPAVCGLLLLAVALPFLQTLRFEFLNYDDDLYVTNNAQVQGGLTADGAWWALAQSHAANWHPLAWLSHMLDCQLYGLRPWGHHLTNIVLHAAAAVLLLAVLQAMTGRFWPSTLAAGFFAVHPLRTESVAWVTERKDVLSGVMFLLGIAVYAWYARRPGSWGRYAALLLVFALGLAAKPMLVTFPLILLLLDYWPLRRWAGWRQGAWLLAEKIPLLVLSAGCCVLTIWAQSRSIGQLEDLSLPWRAANAAVSCVAYLGHFFFPADLLPFYRHPLETIPLSEIIGACLLLAMLTGGAVLARRKSPYLFVGWFWYLVMLVPVIGLVQVGKQGMADRYTYLPQVGIALVVAWATADVVARWPGSRVMLAAAAGVLLALLLGAAWRQVTFWHDSATLWSYTLAHGPSGAVAYNNFGNTFWLAGKHGEAERYYWKALEVDPGYSPAYNNLGNARFRAGDFDQAIAFYGKALSIDPNYLQSHNNLATLLYRKGETEEAAAHCQMALRINPRSTYPLRLLAAIADDQGNGAAAVNYRRRRLALQPDDVETLVRLAWDLATHPNAAVRNGAEAIALAQRALQLTAATDPVVLDVLAAAYAEMGRFPEALATAGKALQIAEQQKKRPLSDAVRARILLYRSGQPCRQASSRPVIVP